MRARRTFGNSPEVFTALDCATVGRLHIFSTTNDRERNRVGEDAGMFSARLVVIVNGRLVDADTLDLNNLTNLQQIVNKKAA